MLKLFNQAGADTRADSLAEARRERRGNAPLAAIGRAPKIGDTGVARFEAGGRTREIAYVTQDRFTGRDLAVALREGSPEARAAARAEARALVEDLIKARVRLDDSLDGDHAAKFGENVGYGRLPGDKNDRAYVLDAGETTRVPEPGLLDRALGRPDPLRVHYEAVLRGLESGPRRVGASEPPAGQEFRLTWLDRSLGSEKLAVARDFHGVAHGLADRIAAAGGERPAVRMEASVLGSPFAPVRLWWQTVRHGTMRQRIAAFSPLTVGALLFGTLGGVPVEGVAFKNGNVSEVRTHNHSYGLATGAVIPLTLWATARVLESKGNKPAHELTHSIEYLVLGLARQKGALESPGEILGVQNDARLYLWGGRNEAATIAAEYSGKLDAVVDMLRLNAAEFFASHFKADPAYARERAARFDEFAATLHRELAAEHPALFARASPRSLDSIRADPVPKGPATSLPDAPAAARLGADEGLAPRRRLRGGRLAGLAEAPPPAAAPLPRWLVEPGPAAPALPAGVKALGGLSNVTAVHASNIYLGDAGGQAVVIKLNATPNEPRVLAAMNGVALPGNVRVPRLLGAEALDAGAAARIEGGARHFDADAVARAAEEGRWLMVMERLPEDFVALRDVLAGRPPLAPIAGKDWQGLLDAVSALHARGLGFGDLNNPTNIHVRQVRAADGSARTEFALIDAGIGTMTGRESTLANDRAQLKGLMGYETQLMEKGLLAARGVMAETPAPAALEAPAPVAVARAPAAAAAAIRGVAAHLRQTRRRARRRRAAPRRRGRIRRARRLHARAGARARDPHPVLLRHHGRVRGGRGLHARAHGPRRGRHLAQRGDGLAAR